jgi:hypothetical protein
MPGARRVRLLGVQHQLNSGGLQHNRWTIFSGRDASTHSDSDTISRPRRSSRGQRQARLITLEYAEIEYAALPANCPEFVIALRHNIFKCLNSAASRADLYLIALQTDSNCRDAPRWVLITHNDRQSLNSRKSGGFGCCDSAPRRPAIPNWPDLAGCDSMPVRNFCDTSTSSAQMAFEIGHVCLR